MRILYAGVLCLLIAVCAWPQVSGAWNSVGGDPGKGSIMLDRDGQTPDVGNFEFALLCEDDREDLSLGYGLFHFKDDGRYTLSWSGRGEGLSGVKKQGFWWKTPNASTWSIALQKERATQILSFVTEKHPERNAWWSEQGQEVYEKHIAAWNRMKADPDVREFFGGAVEGHVNNPSFFEGKRKIRFDDRDVGTVIARTLDWGGREWNLWCARVNSSSIPEFGFSLPRY